MDQFLAVSTITLLVVLSPLRMLNPVLWVLQRIAIHLRLRYRQKTGKPFPLDDDFKLKWNLNTLFRYLSNLKRKRIG